MRIIDVSEDNKELFCLYLEDWSADAKEAGPKRRQWLAIAKRARRCP